MSRPEGEGWLPVKGRPVVCRRGGCRELATDPRVGLCRTHGRLRAAPKGDRNLLRFEPLPQGLRGPGAWARRAACRGTDIDFFPEGRTRAAFEAVEKARAVCVGCRVREACLEMAILNGEYLGIWGGLTVLERRRLRKSRQAAAA